MDHLSSILGDPPAEEPAGAAPAPAPEPNAAPAAEAPTPAPAPAEPDPPKMVPLAALHEERRMRQELQRQQQESERRVEARLAALQQSLQPPAPAAPDPNENPIGYLAHQVATQGQQVQNLALQSQQAHQAAQLAALEQQLITRVQAAEASFAATAPDYQQALGFMVKARVQELQLVNGMDELSAQQHAAREMKEAAYVHAANGRNPAEIVYGMAKLRGFSSKPAAPAAPPPAEQMQMAQRGTAAAQSLGGGGATAGAITAKDLLAMSDAEFEAATKGGKWAQIMGG